MSEGECIPDRRARKKPSDGSKLPWMKFFPADWRADLGLRMTSLAARGLWIEMLTIMHQAMPRGSLLLNGKQLTVRDLAVLTSAPQPDVAAALDELSAAGVFSIDSDRTIYSRRMRRDDAKAVEYRANGEKGGNPALGLLSERGVNPPDKPPDIEGDKAQKPEARGQKPESRAQKPEARHQSKKKLTPLADARTRAFDRFWQQWPNKVGKSVAEKAFEKIAHEIDAILEGVERYVRDKPADRHWLNPTTFLNQRRWEDAPAFVQPTARAGPSYGRYSTDSYINALIESQADDHAANNARLEREYDLDLTANPSS